MLQPLQHYIKPGIVHFMIYPSTILGEGPILETVSRIIEDDYFQVIEISWIKDPEVRAKVKEMLISNGIEAKYGAQPRLLSQKLNLNHPSAPDRNQAVREVKLAIDDAADLGFKDVGILSGAYPGEAQKAAQMALLEKSLNEICAYAATKNINIALEVFDQSIDKKCLIGPAADALEISQRVCQKHDNFGLLVDLSHIPLLNESPAEALQPVAKYVRHIHIGNAYMDKTNDPAYGDQHPRFGYPGGANDVPEIVAFLEELFKIGFLDKNGKNPMPVSFEVKPVGDENAELVIANSKRKLAEAWRILEV